MNYIEVLVAEASYHGNEPLTYSSETPLERGRLVLVPLRKKEVLGVVVASVPKPSFAAKPVASVPDLPLFPEPNLQALAWVHQYYPSPLGVVTQQFFPRQLPKKPVPDVTLAEQPLPKLPTPTKEQAAALAQINNPGMYLLHGDTGTGKTRVYIELARRSLAAGKSAIVLTPEIGLTSQLEHDFKHVFGERVVLIHSQLTDVTRQRIWVRLLRQKQPVVVIGPRSALFSPLHDVGLIVIDESHETAYKQDQAPYYHASRIASKLAELHKAAIVLGSATPLVSDYYLAEAKKRPIIRMSETATGGDHKSGIRVVDLRDRSKFTKKSHLSDELIKAVSDTLAKGEQSLLFLNRRGTARVVFCENCGWQALCPHCDVPLIYHGDTHAMRCHTCDFKAPSPTSCPECKGVDVVFKSIGTKAIVEEVERLFPEARIMRFDTDNKKSERIEQHYDAVKKGDVDIIIGTQTLAKGLDLPKLALVGVIIADTSLFFPDFSAQERTYQLLSQVIGRVGRGHREGMAIIQTFNPESPLLRAIIKKDWDTFYQTEMRERKQFLFPPFCYVLKLTCRRATQNSAIATAEKFADELERSGRRIAVEGPAPAFHEKILNKYQWQLIVKAKDRNQLTDIVRNLPSGWSYDIDPMNLL
jgi:primosomal protein N' (replication factor Y) (superfamily II helicase)